MTYESNSPGETFLLGEKIGRMAAKGDVYCLYGDLGAGKTAFSKGFAKGMGVLENVTSPTFTIMCEYETGKMPLHHFDMYRLNDGSELEAIGAEEYFYGDGVCIIEWPENIEGYLPEKIKKVIIEKNISKGDDYRKITIISEGAEDENISY